MLEDRWTPVIPSNGKQCHDTGITVCSYKYEQQSKSRTLHPGHFSYLLYIMKNAGRSGLSHFSRAWQEYVPCGPIA